MKIDNGLTIKAQNTLIGTSSKIKKNMEKLNSGFRINRAADDAAGLAISEKMRNRIRGLEQAKRNSNDGINLVNVAEGAMQDVDNILDRIKELAVESANGSYDDVTDRAALQLELEQLREEVDKIADATNFNGVYPFQNEGYDHEYFIKANPMRENLLFSDVYSAEPHIIKEQYEGIPLQSLIEDTKAGETNIIYTETTFDYTTTTVNGASNGTFSASYQQIADTLKNQIVPNVVSKIVDTYQSFGYLDGSSIGIGLNLYSDPSSSTLAYVSLTAGREVDGNAPDGVYKGYQLAVNTAKVDLSTEAGRSAFERTVSHEMIHAFMDEAMASGMLGVDANISSNNDDFPMWFVEGMAQTASGPGNWVTAGLGLSTSSTLADISAALSSSNAKLSASGSSTTAQYGTGYLAAMYLGYKAYTSQGGSINMNSSTEAAQKIAAGVSKVLYDITNGSSLQKTIQNYTGYGSISAFESGFATDSDVLSFIEDLLPYTSNGLGGILNGNLSNSDPVPNTSLSGVKLFELNPATDRVTNYYPSDVEIFSGGSATLDGVAPVGGITPPDSDVTQTVYPYDLFTVKDANGNVIDLSTSADCTLDTATGVLKINTDKKLTISGGIVTDNGTDYYGRIEIADNISDSDGDGINADIVLDNVKIDLTKDGGNASGISTGDGNNVRISLADNTTSEIKASGTGAAIQLSGGSSGSTLTINGNTSGNSATDGTLIVVGGSVGTSNGGAAIGNGLGKGSSNNNLIINGGNITANGGYTSAAIGAAMATDFGDITVNGGNINATAKNHGAGIGGGWYGGPLSHVGTITINGGTVHASGVEHGTGIGGGCRGTVEDIIIRGADTVVVAKGGNDGAAIGASWDGKAGDIIIEGGTVTAIGGRRGAGIGSGYQASGGDIRISGGTIIAEGATDAAGIGSGRQGSNTGIYITGGTITATGGLTNNGGNIGAYLPSGYGVAPDAAPLEISPGLSIKAGSGEGLYSTTGATAPDGTQIYGFTLDPSYLPAGFTFPVTMHTTTGKQYDWNNPTQHINEDAAYIWMSGEDHILEVTDANGNTTSLDLVFHPDSGMFRVRGTPAPPAAEKPTYSDNTGTPDYPGKPDTTPDYRDGELGGIILQIGSYTKDTFLVPRFYFSAKALKMDKLDVSTAEKANASIDRIAAMKSRVSEIRSTYGSIYNRLEHTVNRLVAVSENTTAAESQIRDTDMALEMTGLTKNNIILQAGQAMLSQAGDQMGAVLQLLQ